MKITAQATMVLAAIFAVICLSVAITGLSSLGHIADPVRLADAKGFAWFWMFLAAVAAAFGLMAWWMASTQPDTEDD